MDPRLLDYYNRELRFMREMGAEFATEFPKIAGRLGIEGLECADPYVERLLEGFAFLAARVQLRLDAEFPRFTKRMLEVVLPHYLSPSPAAAVVEFLPDLRDPSVVDGVTVPRGTRLRSLIGRDEQTAAEFRTAHDLTLTPLTITEAEYLPTPASIGTYRVPEIAGMRSAIRLRLKLPPGAVARNLKVDQLPMFIGGGDRVTVRLHELLSTSVLGIIVRSGDRGATRHTVLPPTAMRPRGFEDEDALLPPGPRTFQGYRLLQEYFLLPERFQFLEVTGLVAACARIESDSIEMFLVLSRADSTLEHSIAPAMFQINAAPAINLFPHECERIHVRNRDHEHHVVPDRTRPMDFEVYRVERVFGFAANENRQEFVPFYATNDVAYQAEDAAYFTVNRVPRRYSERQKREGARSSYIGSEVYLSLVDGREAPYRSDLSQLAVSVMATNRDLPLHMPLGRGHTDFSLDIGLPLVGIRCRSGPSKPRPAWPEGETSWRLISHLSLNYLSLVDSDPRQGAAALRELLALYGDIAEPHVRKQIDGVRHVNVKTNTARMPVRGPVAFGRGLEVTLELDEAAFEGGSLFLLGAVLERFIARYASINSFTQMVLRSSERGEVMRWPVRSGRRTRL